jgi:hypothetical protein
MGITWGGARGKYGLAIFFIPNNSVFFVCCVEEGEIKKYNDCLNDYLGDVKTEK